MVHQSVNPSPFDFKKESHNRIQYNGYGPVQSCYITMRDGVDLAAEIILPSGLPSDEKIPTILSQTCYWRSTVLKRPFNWLFNGLADNEASKIFASRGFAHVMVDVRGTGASFGTRQMPFSDDELDDQVEIVNWIKIQPWSNGIIFPYGNSYLGITAEFTVSHNLPAVKGAVWIDAMNWDMYLTGYPGGIQNKFFIDMWSLAGMYQDQLRWVGEKSKSKHPEFRLALLLVNGPKPVDPRRFKSAIENHYRNRYVSSYLKPDLARDDPVPELTTKRGNICDVISAYSWKNEIHRTNTPLYIWGSWGPGNSAANVIARFLNLNNPQVVIIGDWDHGAIATRENPLVKGPVDPSITESRTDWVNFFDVCIKQKPPLGKTLYYLTMGEQKWKKTTAWPPVNSSHQIWFFSENNRLTTEDPFDESGVDQYKVDFHSTRGNRHRWSSFLNKPDKFPNMNTIDSILLTYTSDPLKESIEVTGHPIVEIYITSTHEDGAIFAYFEIIDEKEKVILVTEGYLRLIHRKISQEPPPYIYPVPYHSFKRNDTKLMPIGKIEQLVFDLFPTSILIPKGYRIRVAIAGADENNFARYPNIGDPLISIYRNKNYRSNIQIPIIQDY